MDKIVSLPLWQLKNIYEALRITSNIHNCSQCKTCHDRLVTKAISFVEPLIKEEPPIEIKG